MKKKMKLKDRIQSIDKNLLSSQPDMKVNEEFKNQYIETENSSIVERINVNLAKNKTILKICMKIKLDPIYLLLIILIPIIILLLTFFNFTTKIITTLYPLYMSFKTLQYQVNKSKKDGKLYKKEDEDKDTTQWLSYWLFYSFVNNSECILGSLIEKIPLYKLIKFLLLLSCFITQIQTNVIIYTYFTGKLYNLYGENLERSMLGFTRNIFSNNNNDEQDMERENDFDDRDSKEFIDDNFVKRKKNE